eukprot:m.41616 g.41616  ORF g.41616 m.41616 type:complete len:595 (+) comp6159_c0_seq1:30-1814(+)
MQPAARRLSCLQRHLTARCYHQRYLQRHATAASPTPTSTDTLAPQRRVFKQVPPLENGSLIANNHALQWAVERQCPWAMEHIDNVSRLAASSRMHRLAERANTYPPVLRTHDRFGNRVDVAEYDSAYHEVMRIGIEDAGAAAYAWKHASKGGNHTARCALTYMLYQVESGTQCPQTMTFAAYPSLRQHLTSEQNAVGWLDKLTSQVYDYRNVPIVEKDGITLGMSMTERQGGSDVRANTTHATPVDKDTTGAGQAYLLNGHKWFTSAPMSDAFLTLAYTEEGLSCFLVPRWNWRTGERNHGLVFNRLKPKLGDHSNASSEIEYHNAWGEMLGAPGRGIQTILTMVQHTRLDCLVGSAGLMQRCVAEAVHHANHREAFGKLLKESPIMKNVLADLLIESEAATTLAFRIAESFDHNNQGDSDHMAFGRIATAIAKYHICKRAPQVAYEAMECLGGNGYIEEGPMPRLYRQSPLNAIWEGSGNVICLDVLRATHTTPGALDAVYREINMTRGVDDRLDKFVADLPPLSEHNARRVVGALAVALQASLLWRRSDSRIADAFCASRLCSAGRVEYGTLPDDVEFDFIIGRSVPSYQPE